MNSLSLACVALVAPAATLFGSSTDRAIIAAMALSEQPNYSWFSMIDDPASSYEIEGRTTSAGITWVKMPMLSSIGRRLGREIDTQLEALFLGGTRGIVHVGDDWKPIAELPATRKRVAAHRTRPMARGSANIGSFGIPGGPSIGSAAPFLNETRGSSPFTTLRFGVTHPHEELAIIVSSFTKMETAGDVVTGTLSDIGAALLLVRPEQTDVEPLASAGEFKLWIKNGVVTKYQLRLEGVVAIDQWKKVSVHVNSTTSLKDIGTTEVNVPDGAREKFARVSDRSL
jgi:hypothetical protein